MYKVNHAFIIVEALHYQWLYKVIQQKIQQVEDISHQDKRGYSDFILLEFNVFIEDITVTVIEAFLKSP